MQLLAGKWNLYQKLMPENNLLNNGEKEPGNSIPVNRTSIPHAPVIRRISAFIIDNILLLILYLFFVSLLKNDFILSIVSQQIFIISFLYLLFFIHQFYFFIFELFFNGKTLGKWIVRIRVVDKNGNKVNLMNTLTRNFLRAIYFLPPLFFIPDLICLALTSFNKRLGDLAAGSRVIICN
jgi:uncharacterized RDD family membrane protein YckC